MKISGQQTLQFGEEGLISLREGSHVNLTAQQEKEKEQQMIATSGRKCLEQFGRFPRAGLWAKTFADLLIGTGGWYFDQVQADLETEGYEVIPFLLPAAGVNAPHRRDRIWFVAYSAKNGNNQWGQVKEGICGREAPTIRLGLNGSNGIASNTNGKRFQEQQTSDFTGGKIELGGTYIEKWEEWPIESPVCRADDGIPDRVDRLKSLGNAIVPQVAYQIFKAIEEYENSVA